MATPYFGYEDPEFYGLGEELAAPEMEFPKQGGGVPRRAGLRNLRNRAKPKGNPTSTSELHALRNRMEASMAQDPDAEFKARLNAAKVYSKKGALVRPGNNMYTAEAIKRLGLLNAEPDVVEAEYEENGVKKRYPSVLTGINQTVLTDEDLARIETMRKAALEKQALEAQWAMEQRNSGKFPVK
jgi:hypothetical protein